MNLGYLYNNGQGVAKDHRTALRWYRAAAGQGLPDAQNNLGFMHAMGRGVSRDYVKAYMWYSIAMSSGRDQSADNRAKTAMNLDATARELTPRQIEQARAMAKRCMDSNYTECD